MSLLSMIFGSRAVVYDSTREQVILGVVTAESVSRSVELSSYPIEIGAGVKGTVSDHIQAAPETFTIEIVLNDPHLTSIAHFFDRKTTEEKILQLDFWMREGILLTYSGPAMSGVFDRVYQITSDNLVLTAFDITRDVEDGTAIKASLSFSKVTIVRAAMADIKLPQAAKGAAQKGIGTTGTAEVDAGGSGWEGYGIGNDAGFGWQ